MCDRYLDSSRAYQGGALADADILALHAVGSHGLTPDRTFLLLPGENEAIARLILRDGDQSDRIGSRPSDYHRAVAARFRAFAAAEPARFITIDAAGTIPEVHNRILCALAPLLVAA